eukprot:tig00001024_g6315.t1
MDTAANAGSAPAGSEPQPTKREPGRAASVDPTRVLEFAFPRFSLLPPMHKSERVRLEGSDWRTLSARNGRGDGLLSFCFRVRGDAAGPSAGICEFREVTLTTVSRDLDRSVSAHGKMAAIARSHGKLACYLTEAVRLSELHDPSSQLLVGDTLLFRLSVYPPRGAAQGPGAEGAPEAPAPVDLALDELVRRPALWAEEGSEQLSGEAAGPLTLARLAALADALPLFEPHDLAIEAGGQLLLAHRAALAARFSSLPEAVPPGPGASQALLRVKPSHGLPPPSAGVVRAALRYAYTGVAPRVPPASLPALLALACSWGVRGLPSLCAAALGPGTEPARIVQTFAWAATGGPPGEEGVWGRAQRRLAERAGGAWGEVAAGTPAGDWGGWRRRASGASRGRRAPGGGLRGGHARLLGPPRRPRPPPTLEAPSLPSPPGAAPAAPRRGRAPACLLPAFAASRRPPPPPPPPRRPASPPPLAIPAALAAALLPFAGPGAPALGPLELALALAAPPPLPPRGGDGGGAAGGAGRGRRPSTSSGGRAWLEAEGPGAAAGPVLAAVPWNEVPLGEYPVVARDPAFRPHACLDALLARACAAQLAPAGSASPGPPAPPSPAALRESERAWKRIRTGL